MLPSGFPEAMANPPQVHDGAESGVWYTERACYEFIGEHAGPGSATLETGIGLSTVEFALLGCEHTSVFLDELEGTRLLEWAAAHGIDLSRVRLCSGGSEQVLPGLDGPSLDLVFIDGCHGYPLPQVDFVYSASRLRTGGILVVDDTQLWAPLQLAEFLDADPRWERLAGTTKWAAFRRLGHGTVAEEWDAQPFVSVPPPPVPITRRVAKSLPDPLQRAARAAERFVRGDGHPRP